jgi:hypothetical protein
MVWLHVRKRSVEDDMICAVCFQPIEQDEDESEEYRHSLDADLKWCLDLGCLGEAVPKEDKEK